MMTARYPEPPPGSKRPPEEFRHKMGNVEESIHRVENNDNDNNTEEPSFGMFSEPLFTWDNLPCSLHFQGAQPTPQAKTAMKLLHDDLLGNSFGEKEGNYGAGGGGVHILYLGRPPLDDEDGRNAAIEFPNIDNLLAMLCLSNAYKPETMKWMTTTDPIHQQLFHKRKSEFEEEADEAESSVLSLEAFVHLLDNQMDTRQILSRLPPHVTANYPCLESGRVVFLLPRFQSVHDGDCLSKPMYCPTAVAFESRTDHEEYWSAFQARPEVNVDVFLEESSSGQAKEAGDVYESPVLALFQLATTGEIMGLAQWDYRD